MTTNNNTLNAVNTAVEGGATIGIMAFFSTAMIQTLPWLLLAIPFLLLDLLYGIRAARHRGDKVRMSTAVRRSVDKAVAYIMWVAAAVMLAQLFGVAWLDKAVLALVFGNEFISIIGNYLETKNVELSISEFWKLIFRKGAEKVGVEVSKDDVEGVLKPKPQRDARGRFVKRQ